MTRDSYWSKFTRNVVEPRFAWLVTMLVSRGYCLDTSRGRVRLFGVDRPERGQHCATEATELAGDTVRLEDGPRLTDAYGRTLAYVYTVGGISIDAALIREGFASAWTRDGQHLAQLVSLERQAQIARVGCLW